MTELTYVPYSALKDLVAVLSDYFNAEGISADFPPDLTACIANYVQVHEKGNSPSESKKVLEELKELATKNSSRADLKLPLLLKCLKELREVLEPEDVIEVFEDRILLPILNPYGQVRTTLNDAKDVLLFCLITKEDAEGERKLLPLHFRLFEIFIRKSKDVQQGLVPVPALAATKFTISTLEKVLLDFGDKCPRVFKSCDCTDLKEFLMMVDKYYVQKENRLVASVLLCRFCAAHDHHLYKVLKTNLFDHILQSLEIDTSSATVIMSLTVLVMLLPNICNAISEQIPQLFFILYRIVCWKKPAKTIDPTSLEEVEESTYPIGHRRENWDAAGPSEDSLRTPSPKGDQLFTFLYGLFPVNLLKFLQSPQEYLEERHIFISPLDEETFKSQAETILSRHTFNPDILKYTLDSEINDSKKWIELEPSEIATKCSSLDSTNKLAPTNANRQSQPPTGPLPKPPMVSSLLSKSLDIEAQRTFPFGSTDLGQPSSWMPRSRNGTGIGMGTSYIDEGNSIFSPREGQTSRSGYRTSLTSGLASVPQGTEQIGGFNNEEEVKPREFAQDAPFNSQRTSTSENSQASNEDKKRNSVEDVAVPPEALASLEMELKLLQAQIEFERLLKRRYLQQIARLQRKKVLQSSSDAEREHYITEIADLKRQVGELLDDLHRQQQETSLYKQQRAQVEENLYEKIKRIGDEKTNLKSEVSRLQLELESIEEENTRLRKNQTHLDSQLLKTRQDSQDAVEIESSATNSKIDSLKAEIAEWKDRVGSQRELEAQKTKLEAQCKRLEMRLQVAEDTNRSMSKRLTQLMSESADSQNKESPSNPKLRLLLDSIAKTNAAQISRLEQTYENLVKQYRSLENAYRDLQLLREADKREFLRQRSVPKVQDGPPRLLDDGLSVDSRLRVPWDSSGGSTVDSSASSVDSPTTETGSGVPQLRPSGSPDNPFSGVLPRRLASTSPVLTAIPTKIKPNSEIRQYGRGGAQNIGMKPKKKDKGLTLG